jgi:hypothetical protein
LPPPPLALLVPLLPEPLLEALEPVPDVAPELPPLVVLPELELPPSPLALLVPLLPELELVLPVVPELPELPDVLPADVLLVVVGVDVLAADGGVNCKFQVVPFQVD